MKWTYAFDMNRYEDDVYLMDHPEIAALNAGDAVLVASRRNLMTGKESYQLYPQYAESGYPGNTDHSIKRFHGWRGTTNDTYVEAHGVYTVKSADRIGSTLKIVLGKVDIKSDEE